MKILFVSTVPVFPPSDGVRIPPANYIEGLSQSHEVDFLLLENACQEADWQATAEKVKRFWKTPIRRRSKLVGISKELVFLGPYYGNWQFQGEFADDLAETKYDAVIACTPTAIALLSKSAIRSRFHTPRSWIAAMSDVHSLVVGQQSANASKNYSLWRQFFQRVVYGLRTQILASNEMTMLAQYSTVFVQTDKEREWISRQGGDNLFKKTMRLTNAVHDDLFQLSVERTQRRVVFVGSLTGLYGERLRWFIHHVWQKLKQKKNRMTLTAIGKGANEQLTRTMQECGVEYVPYVENLDDIYRNHDILIAPIFKGYGLINKVVEAMAAGCLVVGDKTAFNGIPDFETGQQGLVANTEEEFRNVFCHALEDNESLNKIRKHARALMQQHFRWQQRVETIERTLEPENIQQAS